MKAVAGATKHSTELLFSNTLAKTLIDLFPN